MVYVRPPRAAERRELGHRARTAVGRVSERMRMVLLSDRRSAVPVIAAIFECGEAPVRGWLARAGAEGIAGLAGRRPPVRSSATNAMLPRRRPGMRSASGPEGPWGRTLPSGAGCR